MMRKGWTLDDISWDDFDPSEVDPDILKVVKAASMVEYNGGDYAAYLCNVFPDDEDFQAAAKRWAGEEVQHGQALGRWAELADPTFDFQTAFNRFRAGYKIPVEAETSVRGSRSGELVARCIVEVGTSSYYSALGSAATEPVLKQICRHIAADELRHYRLFYTHLKHYLKREGIGRWRRIAVALGRIRESEDDELAYAYYAANGDGEAYDRRRWSRAYIRRATGFYRQNHIDLGIAMTFKAAGLDPQGRLARLTSRGAYGLLRFRNRQLTRANA